MGPVHLQSGEEGGGDFNRPKRISQKLKEIQKKVLYKRCKCVFSWGKEDENKILYMGHYQGQVKINFLNRLFFIAYSCS